MTTAVIIVAAGRGLRARSEVPKQWCDLGGVPVLAQTLRAFRASTRVTRYCLVIHPDDAAHLDRIAPEDLPPELSVVSGGATRTGSVRAGLEALAAEPPGYVLIHDAARPLVSVDLIGRVIDALAGHDGAAPALEVTDALWRGAGGVVVGTPDRAGLWRAQTPQGFRYAAILAAHRGLPDGESVADDVAVARAARIDVAIVAGDDDNLKITRPGDFARAARLMEARSTMQDIRTGNGFDVHRFCPGDHVTLCGVAVPFGQGLEGHSDADVGMHAVTDALYGALAAGDVGTYFPPSDARWKGAESHIFLSHACAMAREKGYRIAHADVTLICEAPAIGPHAAAMRAAMARIMGIEDHRMSVKATTSERLGFTGRGEGIAALATATLVLP